MQPVESHSAFLWLALVLVKSLVNLEVSASTCYDNGGRNVTEENEMVRENAVEDIYIRHYYGPSMCDYNENRLSKWPLLLTAPQYKPEGISTLYIHGFTETPLSSSVITVTRAYLARRDDNNFFFLDWSNMDHEPYFFNAMPNCPKVANETARVLSKLFGKGLELSKFHLVGHSLGGQISGMIGKAIADHGITLKRISGLDPAGPGFNTEVYSTTHLEATDAEFVDVVHTDAAKFGTRRHSGHADFWPNGGVMQPGCPEDSVREHVFCSHQRSWMYWAESVMNPHTLEARRIPSISDVQFLRWDSDRNETVNIAYMGIAADSSSRGDYFLLTNSNSPYGRGKEGL